MDAASRLSFDEIELLVRGFVRLGVRKLRLTGGEPLLRRGLPELVSRLAAIDGIEDLALTTNGALLAPLAAPLRAAGLHRVTVSLDALEPGLFRRLTGGRGELEAVLAGIEAARVAGFAPLKLNCVIQRGVNEDQLVPLVAFAREHGLSPRFIEFMDVGTCNDWRRDAVVTSAELRDRLHARWPLRPLRPSYRGEVAERHAFEDGAGEVGFVSSVSTPFCGDCHRARVSANGHLYTCLFASGGAPLRALLAEGEDALVERLSVLWARRADRYSEMRGQSQAQRRRVEMFLVGG